MAFNIYVDWDLTCRFLKTFQDGENEGSCKQTGANKYSPKEPELHLVPHNSYNGNTIISNGCCSQPGTLHHTLILWWRYLGDER